GQCPTRLLRRRRYDRMPFAISLEECRPRGSGWDGANRQPSSKAAGLLASIFGGSEGSGGVSCAGPVTSCSDQRACGGASSASVSPSASRSAPAQAIIAPLSVHKAAGGSTSTVPVSNATWCRTLRIAWLAATPPPATSAFGLP